MLYGRGSQPVVRVPLVVREQVLGGTQKDFKTKILQYFVNLKKKYMKTPIFYH